MTVRSGLENCARKMQRLTLRQAGLRPDNVRQRRPGRTRVCCAEHSISPCLSLNSNGSEIFSTGPLSRLYLA